MVSEAKKKATKKYRNENTRPVNVRIGNDDMLKLQQICLTCGLQPGAASRLWLQALAHGDEDALSLLRRLATSRLDD